MSQESQDVTIICNRCDFQILAHFPFPKPFESSALPLRREGPTSLQVEEHARKTSPLVGFPHEDYTVHLEDGSTAVLQRVGKKGVFFSAEGVYRGVLREFFKPLRGKER